MLELWTGLVVLVVVIAGVGLMRSWAKHRLLDVPNERSSHSQPTPRGGGLVIVIAVLAGLIPFLISHRDWPLRQTLAFFVGAILIAGVSWLDDLRSLSNRLRLAVHFLAAGIVIFGTGRVLDLGTSWIFAATVTLVWIAGLTNAYNFMDGIDGIAGTQAVVAGIGWSLLAGQVQSPTTATFGLILAAGSLGFLIHNWSPAKIFMGDVGSAFLGFAFATMPLLTAEPLRPLAAVLVVWPFVFDTSFTFLRRLRHRENVFSAHRSHLYQRMVIAGLSHGAVTLLYGLLAAIGAGLAVWSDQGTQPAGVAEAVVAALSLGLWLLVVRTEIRQRKSSTPR